MLTPKISVITVVFKDPEGLERTIQSVREQNYPNIEHIVIDGGSGEETVALIKKYKKDIAYWVSEPDSGIYDAMNKGIDASTGQWVNFMNAGDVFYSADAVQQVFSGEPLDDYALVYGYKYQDGKPVHPLPLWQLEKGIIMACHQSMFFNKTLAGEQVRYDLRYPIYGDYELVNRLYLAFPDQFKQVDVPVAIFEGGGISSKPSKQKRVDKYAILWRHYGLWMLLKALWFRIVLGIKQTYGSRKK